jgi:hypothetical protein
MPISLAATSVAVSSPVVAIDLVSTDRPEHMARAVSATTSRLSAMMQVAGGVLVVIGAWLPWLTMFAGLQTIRGTVGWNGRALLIGGVLVALGGGAALLGVASRNVRRVVSLVAALIGGGGMVLLVRLISTWRELTVTDALMVPRLGPGVFLIVIGALLATAALVPMERR